MKTILRAVLLLLAFANLAHAQSPEINRIDPDHVVAGAANTPIMVYGRNLSGPIVFNGGTLSTTVVSSHQLHATVPSTSLTTISTVTVHTGSSNSLTFRILTPLLPVAYYTPTNFAAGVSTPIAVFGSSFDSSSTILFDWQPVTTTFVPPNELTGTVPGGIISQNQTHHIFVYAGAFTSASISTVQSLPVITSDQPQISISNIVIGTSLVGTATIRALQGTITLSSPFYTIAGTDSADFAKSGGGCANGKVLTAGSSCTIQITATPAAFPTPPPAWVAGNSYALNFEIVDNANGDPNGTPHLQKATTAGTSEAGVSPVMGGATYPDFLWNESGGTTAEGPDTLIWTDQGRYIVSVSESATLSVNSNAANNPQSIPLALTKTVPSIGVPALSIGVSQLNPAGYDFGSVTQSTPTSRAVTMQNDGAGYMDLGSPFYTIAGANAADFALSGGTCVNGQNLLGGSGITSSAGQSCSFNLTFTPSATGSRTATLNLAWTSIGGTVGSASQVLTGAGKTAGTKIHISWTASTSSSVTGYNVYRGNQGGPYTLIASGVSGTSYDDTSVSHGNTYCYVVRAVGSNPPYTTAQSGNSNESCATF